MPAKVLQTEERPLTAEQCWALVERVASSSELRRAARLRAFLLYVCDRTLRQGATVIHEQEIGAAVFERPKGYDTGIDNIVRVNATELRKRLEHFFAGEGRNEEIVLEIQRGTYTPTFHWRKVAPDAKPEKPKESEFLPETNNPGPIPEPVVEAAVTPSAALAEAKAEPAAAIPGNVQE